MRKVLTEEHKKFIDANCYEISAKDIGKALGVPKGTVRSYLWANGVTIPKEITNQFKSKSQREKTTSTPEIDKVILDNYLTVPIKRLAKMMDKGNTFLRTRIRQLGLVIPAETIEQNKQVSRLKPGNTPINKGKKWAEYLSPEAQERILKTGYQKGHLPHNCKGVNDGDIRIRKDSRNDAGSNNYKWIRISLGKWKMLHVVVWESVHGPVPEGYIVVFKDKDTMNCSIDNLELITRAENMIRNSASMNLVDGYVVKMIIPKKERIDNPGFVEAIMQRPDLIELKRMQMQLKRTIKKTKNA